MQKAQILNHWQHIKPNQPIDICPVPYKHQGSTFDQDGIRITGSPEFIDSILSRLTDLLQYENVETRLQLAYQEAKDKDTGALLGSYSCYVQVHERGREAQIFNAIVAGAKARQEKRALELV